MLLWMHVRNFAEARAQLQARGLWEREPLEVLPPPSAVRRWYPMPSTRPLTPAERQVDLLMREIPEPAHAG